MSATTPDPIFSAQAHVESIRRWTRGDETAPHKPLLLLLALKRVQDGAPRLVDFNDIEPPLRDLLHRFGPKRQNVHPEYPFWRLQRDGLWEVIDADSFPSRQSNTDPPLSVLRARHAQGGLPESLDRALRKDRNGLRALAEAVAARFFPDEKHDVLRAVGLG